MMRMIVSSVLTQLESMLTCSSSILLVESVLLLSSYSIETIRFLKVQPQQRLLVLLNSVITQKDVSMRINVVLYGE